MSGKEVEIIGSNTASAISYAQNIENGMKDSLNQAKNLKAYVTCAKWNGKTRCLLSYLDLIIQYNSEMVEAFEGHTKALKELEKSIQTYGDISEVRAIKNCDGEMRNKRMGKEMIFAPAELYVLAGAAGLPIYLDCQTVTQLFT